MKKLRNHFAGFIVGTIFSSSIAYAAISINIEIAPLKYFFDGVQKIPPSEQQGFIYNGRTYVPLRFMSEALGKEVSWDGENSSIYVGKKPEESNNIANTSNNIKTVDGTFDRIEIQDYTHLFIKDLSGKEVHFFCLSSAPNELKKGQKIRVTWQNVNKFLDPPGSVINIDEYISYQLLTEEGSITEDDAISTVSNYLGKIPKNYRLASHNQTQKDGGTYFVIQFYELVVDDPSTGEGHTATIAWYYVDTKTGKIFKLDIAKDILKAVE